MEKIILIILGSSVVSTLITKFWDYLATKKLKSKKLKFDLLLIANIFETYAFECSFCLGDGLTRTKYKIPDFPVFAIENNLSEFDNQLVQDVIEFPLYVKNAIAGLSYGQEVEGYNEDTAEYHISYLGMKSLNIAKRIKSHLGLELVNDKIENFHSLTHLIKVSEKYLKK